VIAKITRGTSIGGLVRYLLGPGKANEHSGQRVVTGSGIENTPVGEQLSVSEVRELLHRIDALRADYGLPTGGKPRVGGAVGPSQLPGFDGEVEGRDPPTVWHLSLTNAAGDRMLTDEEWCRIAEGAMDTMGFTEASGKAPVRWVAIRHGLSAGGHDHLHVAVSLVRGDGTKASVFRDYKTMSAYAAKVEQEYGLSVVDGRKTAGLPGLSRGEKEKAAREGAAEPPRTRLARVVREAAAATKDEAEFVRRLRQAGLSVRPRFAEGGQESVVGYSVGLAVHDGRTVWFGGRSLASDLSLPRLRQFWEASPSSTRAAVAAWRGARPADGRESWRVSGTEWTKRAAAAIDQAYDKLITVPVDDHAQWASVAREAAGVYAAWSRRVEGDKPGPLARAADALARSAQVAPGTPTPVRSPIRGYWGAAMVVAQGSFTFDDRGTGWSILLGQLNRTLRLLARVHDARGEQRQAEQLRSIEQQLRVVREAGSALPRRDRQRGPRGPESARGTARSGLAIEEDEEDRRRRRPGPELGRGR